MAGSILGADQVAKVNAAFPAILAHIRALLPENSTPHQKMKVHFLTEFLDTTELATIFAGLPFLAPAEKRALVRAAIYEVLPTVLTHQDTPAIEIPVTPAESSVPAQAGTYTPPAFKLNVNTALSTGHAGNTQSEK